MHRKRVLLDCDGVLSNFVGGWLKLINATFDSQWRPEHVTGWDVCASLGLTEERKGQAKKLIANCPGFASKLEIYPGAQVGVRDLQQVADVYVVTSPWNSHPTWTHDREAWLRRNFDIKSDHIVHTSAKHICVGDVLVDDKTSACHSWQTANPGGVAVQWRTPHNRSDAWNGISTHSWNDLLNIVTAGAS